MGNQKTADMIRLAMLKYEKPTIEMRITPTGVYPYQTYGYLADEDEEAERNEAKRLAAIEIEGR